MSNSTRHRAGGSKGGRIWSGVWVVAAMGAAWAAAPIGCGSDEVCTPGEQIECACPGGAKGAQSCNSDGSALEDCECGSSTTGTPAGSGGGTASSGSPASSGASTPASASSGGQSCDSAAACEDSDMDNTNDCVDCVLTGAEAGTCQSQLDACTNDEGCIGYLQCFSACPKPPMAACIDRCKAAEPAGAAVFQAVADCFCGRCPTTCASSAYCG